MTLSIQLSLGDLGKSTPLVVGYRCYPDSSSIAIVASSENLQRKNTSDAIWLKKSLTNSRVEGKSDEVRMFTNLEGQLIVAVALPAKNDLEGIRRAAGVALRSLIGHKKATIAIECKDSEEFRAVVEGATLGAYQFQQFKGDRNLPHLIEKISFLPGRTIKNANGILKRTEILVGEVNFVRDLINMPPSYLTPEKFVSLVKDAVHTTIKVTVKTHIQLKSEGYGGITAVGQGSANPPRLLHLSYKPKGAKKKFAYIGKGITFDTGGLALKPAQGMEAMKSDMSGAAAVVGAINAIAQLKLPVAIDAWAPLAENMVSESATRPSDIITIYGGKTVEVLNPDAEGRLILADALVRAVEVTKDLDGIIDIATLTGAQIVALGKRTAAVMGNDESFRSQFLAAAATTGESFWPMPLPEELRPSLDSPVADLANIGERMGGMLVAGLFLREFVPADLPWLHLDIAGPSFNDGQPHGYTPVGGVGFAIRSLVRFAEVTSIR
ncbi:MAG: leucyl aminopeptidase [Actinobacteria bacterium]|uniref:Probable cytosol aminopeptidase n=1 Tax=Candidatus Fonsibacter lacus TaxID=2576439 RepID=A0A965GCL7_9PROT|nr:leucyl aminopeptidase [Candidatus Fonsibacter lacus]